MKKAILWKPTEPMLQFYLNGKDKPMFIPVKKAIEVLKDDLDNLAHGNEFLALVAWLHINCFSHVFYFEEITHGLFNSRE